MGFCSSAGACSGVCLLPQGAGGAGRSRLTDQELAEVEVVRKLVDSYFNISRKNMADMVRGVVGPAGGVWRQGKSKSKSMDQGKV